MKKNELLKLRIEALEREVTNLKCDVPFYEQFVFTSIKDKLSSLIKHLNLSPVYHMPGRPYWGFEKLEEDKDARKETK